MRAEFHRQITREVLAPWLNERDLETVIAANIGQDHLWSFLFHPEHHFDDSAFAESEAYIDAQRTQAVTGLLRGERVEALQALGRLLHTRQDFYSHANWVQRWVDSVGGFENVVEEEIPICEDPIHCDGLFSARADWLPHLLYMTPLVGPLIKRVYLPPDLHEAMHLDDPSRGPLFPLSLIAARKHTQREVDDFVAALGKTGGTDAVERFRSTENPRK